VIEMTCQTCGEKVGVQSFLTAAQQPCVHCGQLLMGALSRGTRTARPPGFAEPLPSPEPVQHGRGSSAGLWVGLVAGGLVGAVAVALLGPALPPAQRGPVLGALMGVLLSPVFAVCSFFSMLILPFSLEGILGDSLWNRLARAHQERKPRLLFFPILIYVGLPMALCAWAGSKVRNPDSLLVAAGLGAVVLGAILGAVFGSLLGKSRQV
jgi:MFS family permease